MKTAEYTLRHGITTHKATA